MKIIVIGLGSMGKRRIRLLKQYDSSLEIIGIDANSERCAETKEKFSVVTYSSLAEVMTEKIDCAFICTPPLTHAEYLKEMIRRKIDTFTEINLTNEGYSQFVAENDVKLFLSSTFLYRKDIQYLCENVKPKVNYLYHTGQYLPDWHPWESYQNFFVSNPRTNGCREILAIELPWIVRCFGKISKFSVLSDKLTNLNLSYADNYLIQIEHENGNKGQIAVDVVTRIPVRRLEVYNESLRICWDGTPDSLQAWNGTEMEHIATYENIIKDFRYSKNIIENAYMEEIDAFFRWRNGDASQVLHNFQADGEILEIIDRIEGIV